MLLHLLIHTSILIEKSGGVFTALGIVLRIWRMGQLPLSCHSFSLAAWGGASSGGGCYMQMSAVLILTDCVHHAAEGGLSIGVDGGPHRGSDWLLLAGSSLCDLEDTFAIICWLHVHNLVNQHLVAEVWTFGFWDSLLYIFFLLIRKLEQFPITLHCLPGVILASCKKQRQKEPLLCSNCDF